MSNNYVHAKIGTQALSQTPKSVKVNLDGVNKHLAYSKILTIDTKAEGTVNVEDFKANFDNDNPPFIESVEMDHWLATEIHNLEIIED